MASGPESDSVRLLRGLYEAWDARDFDTVFGLLHTEVKWINPDYAVEPGTRTGHQGVATVLRNLDASFASYSHVLGEVVARGDHLLWHTIFRARGRDSGAQVDIPEQHLWTLRDGLVLALRWFHDAAEAEQAAADLWARAGEGAPGGGSS